MQQVGHFRIGTVARVIVLEVAHRHDLLKGIVVCYRILLAVVMWIFSGFGEVIRR